MFELTEEEKSEVVANCDHLTRIKFSPYLPYAFSEHGTLMLANVLNSPKAMGLRPRMIMTTWITASLHCLINIHFPLDF
jgi:hypothetical protein